MSRLKRLPRARVFALCGSAVIVVFALIGSAALAEPLCGISHSGANCFIDSNGCEIAQGIGLTNNCNYAARGDGTSFWVRHQNIAPAGTSLPPTSTFTAGGTGSSSYVSLYCSDSSSTALFKGQLSSGQQKTCQFGSWPVFYAFRSVCGPNTACQNY